MGSQFSTTVKSGPKAKSVVRIWDSLAQPRAQKVNLEPRRENIITWYACGPTVYDSAHIGHASSYIRLDTIRRILERQNYAVLQVMGITDIDDKIIQRANQLEVPWESLTRKYETEFTRELKDLNIQAPLARARVTNFIPQIVSFIEKLVSSGYGYRTSDGSVYFDSIAYGQPGLFRSNEESDEFTRQDLADAVKLKRHNSDFALWKGVKPNEPFWLSPWGKGRPGWHIECSVIASHYFGPFPLDIHSGGSDLMFPHHQCEENQCCARFGIKKWVRHWIHTGHLIVQQGDNEQVKMSKSLGNTVTIKDCLKEYSPNVLRMLCLSHNFRTHLYYHPGTMEKAKMTLRRFESFILDCDAILQGIKPVTCDADAEQYLWNQLSLIQKQIEDALCDDFDTPVAITLMDEFISNFNRRFKFNVADHTAATSSSSSPTTQNVSSIDFQLILMSKNLIQEFLICLGFNMESQRVENTAESRNHENILQDFIEFRQQVRSFSLAIDEVDKKRKKEMIQERQDLVQACDQIRERLGHYGIEIKDHGKNSSWSKNAN